MSDTKSTYGEYRHPVARGEYHAPSKTDTRGPCPVVNSLANHGYISRDGRNVTAAEMYQALREIGVGHTIATPFTYVPWLENRETLPSGLWAFITAPFVYMFSNMAVRRPGQVDAIGTPCIDIDQLALHGQIEHDVSISRRDKAQGDNNDKQDDLVAALVKDCSDGRMMTTADWGRVRQRRLEEQVKLNPGLDFSPHKQTIAAGEIGLVQIVFGLQDQALSVPLAYIKAIFEEERLPIKEGWKKRSWWPANLLEMVGQIGAMRGHMGKL